VDSTLKISRSVVSTLGVSQSGVPILRAIMAVANSLDMKVIAQGIETEDQIHNLVELKCDYGQGFLFTTPTDGDAAQKLLYGAFSTQRH
jgi:EAL domain-containing protein (putative c-di-GMP-specific phosphodiesterase class I)